TLDLSEQVKALNNDPLAVEVSISQANSIIQCDQPRPGPDDSLPDPESWATDADNPPAWVRRFYQNERYRWQNRDNPCTPEFYAYGNYETRDVSYYYQSSLGLIAKLGQDHQLRVVVTDVRNAEAVSGASVTAYNRQNQIVADGKTNNEGMVTLSPLAPPAYLMVNHNDQAGFLRLDRNEALSTNVFDIRGESVSNGLKGYFYGERGIWRPGDDIYLTFILHDRAGSLPADFPLSVDFFNPQGAKVSTITQTSPIEGFYHFHLGTSADAPTGNWRAVVRIGTRYFSKIIPVETVKPNKLKLALTLPAPTLRWQPTNAPDTHLFAQWLNGASANGLRATVSARPASTTTSIAGYSQFIFDDPVRRLTNEEQALFEGTLDPSGWATFKINPQMPEAPGQVSLHLTSRVFEKSGNFSIQYQTVPYIPFQRLVGLNLPEGQGWNNAMGRDEQHELQLVLLDQQSQPLADQSLNLAVYRLDWRWWWESGADNLANYLGSNAASRLVNETLTTNDAGLARWQLNGQDFDWGRYLIRACDDKGSHCTGKVIYLGWSDNNRQDPGAASQLTLATDKLDYVPGETAMIQLPDNLPGPDQAAVLLTIESGSGVLSQRWIEQDIQQHHYGLSITEAMAPNVYAHITVLQKYDGKTSDTPLRLYGIVPVVVNNPATRLLPVLNVPERIKPLSPLTVSVSEASGKPMTYTLAVVDEGLLGLTGFRTPDPQAALYQREALGVLTWDLFDQFPAGKDTQSTLMTIGGGQAAAEALNKHLQKRFKPVVRFLGPFTLTAGATAEHRTDIPDYMGAVRVMVVAGSRQGELPAYGYAGTTVTVTQALGVVTTLPRVLAPGESISLPVNIFNNRSDIGEVDVQITTNGLLEAATEIQTVGFSEPGDQIITVPLRVLENTGEAEVTVTVSGGGESATERLTVPVRSPNTIQTDTRTIVVAANSRATLTLPVNGIPGSNQSLIEVSRLPALNLNERLSYLLEYPHGCLEQTTSGLFAQLYLGKLTTLTDEQTRAAERHVRQGIIRLKDYQSDRGNFHYWPGSQYRNDWANTWAGHFLLEARNQGYTVPADMLSRWLTDQRNRAKQSGFRPGYEATDAYLLFSLALAEQPDFGAMNRLRQMLIADDVRTSNMNLARWLLAAAYGLAGQPEAGQPLLAAADLSTSSYSTAGYTFGSRLRDTAVLALAQLAAGERTQAWQALRQLATGMNEADWVSTQTSGWALLALSSYYGEQDVTAQAFRWRQAQAPWLDTALQSPVFQSRLPADAGTEISVELDNQSPDPLYLLLSNRGIPAAGDETAASSQLHMSASYSTLEGKPLSPALIPQGEDFIATVVISAADPSRQLDNLALTMIMPGGWELSNARLQGGSLPGGLDHQDIRDDRVMSYFSLSPDQPELVLNFTLNATYAGRYYLPGWHTEAMYNHDIYSRLNGQWVRVQPN
ncbi:MAG: hypothetical protein KDI36_13435, partial [Pseudomonadales bacterium]|nr:hypothetical protein [Pseudomonadales bacterium]